MIYFSRSKEELEQKNGTLLYKYTYSDIETFPFQAISTQTFVRLLAILVFNYHLSG